MTITTYTKQDLTDHLIAWFLSHEGEELAEMIYKTHSSSPHYPPLMREQVIDRVADGARMWCESGPDCEKIPRLTDDPNDIDWRRLAVAIVDWYRGPAPEGDFPTVMHPGWSRAYLARAWDRVDEVVRKSL